MSKLGKGQGRNENGDQLGHMGWGCLGWGEGPSLLAETGQGTPERGVASRLSVGRIINEFP